MIKQSKQISPNQKVMDILQKSKKPLTAYEILAKLNKSGVNAPPTVYRALTKLIKDGAVHKIESLNAFMACQMDDHDCHMDNFVVCKSCGTVEEIHDHRIDKIISEWSKNSKFKVEREMVEILGTCDKCNQSSTHA